MKLKKCSAILGLLSIIAIICHISYCIFTYLAMYYNPVLTTAFSMPLVICVCLHAIFGMLTVFLQKDGGDTRIYPKENVRTVLQRISAALIFPLLFAHVNTFRVMKASAESGQTFMIYLFILIELLFFAVILTHIAVSFTNCFVTFGWLSSAKVKKVMDISIYIICALAYILAIYSIVLGQVGMFLLS